MTYLWTQGKTVGNNDPSVSPYLKTWVYQSGVVVCGVTGEGTSKEIQANWDSPFEGESIGSKFGFSGGLLQSGAADEFAGKIGIDMAARGITSINTLQSRQVWGGNRPTQFNIVLHFYALSDPRREVINALVELEKMISPQVNDATPFGRVPSPVIINIGRNAIYPDCVIESVSMPLDKEVNKDGLLIRADVNITIQTMQMLNRSDISSKYS